MNRTLLFYAWSLWFVLFTFFDTADDAFYTPYCHDLRRALHLVWYTAFFLLNLAFYYEIFFGRHGVLR